MSEKSSKNIKNTCKTNIYKFRANSKKAQQVNPSSFKSAQDPWTYLSGTYHSIKRRVAMKGWNGHEHARSAGTVHTGGFVKSAVSMLFTVILL